MVRSRSTKRLALLIAIVFLSISAWSFWKAYAAIKTWTGAGISNPDPAFRNNSWTNRFNWSGNAVPVAGDDLVFGGSAQPVSQNNFPSGTSFESINIGGGHTITGNSLALNSGIIATTGTIATGTIKLNNDQTFNAPLANQGATIGSAIDTNGKRLNLTGPGNFVLGGVISGSGRVEKKDNGLTVLTGNNTYTGQTVVNAGTMIVNGSQPQSDLLQFGGVFGGGGTIGSLGVQSIGGTPSKLDPGNPNNGTAILNVGHMSVINDEISTIFKFDLNGTTPGSGYDQLNVTGAVDLGNSTSTLGLGLGFAPPPGTSFVLIRNDGTDRVDDNFAGLPEGATIDVNDLTFVISYKGGDGNDVVLHVRQTKTWDGGGTTNNWSDAANWTDNVAPSFGDKLVFPANAAQLTNNNDFPLNTTFDSIQFTGAPYTLNGHTIALTSGIIDTADFQINNTIRFGISLNRNVLVSKTGSAQLVVNNIETRGFTLTLDGSGATTFDAIISGTGGLTINGSGFVVTFGLNDNTFSGPTTVNAGTFAMLRSQNNSAVILNGGEFRPSANLKSLQANSGLIRPEGSWSSTGDVTFSPNVTLEVGLARTTTTVTETLVASGQVNLSNANLVLTPNFTVPPSAGDIFTIIRKDSSGPVQGTFNNLPEGQGIVVNGVPMVINYSGNDGNDVVLRVPVTRRWDGGSAVNSNWTTKENWEGDVAPLAGDSLEFPAGAARLNTVNDFPPSTLFNSVTLLGAGYSLTGNGVSLMGGVNETVTSGPDNQITVPVTLNASQSFVTAGPGGHRLSFGSISLGDKTLTLDGTGPCNIQGPIVGSGSIRRRGTGQSALTNNNTYTGPTTVESGTLVINGTQPNSAVTLTNGRLTGSGTMGPLVATGGTVRPSADSPLTIAGNVSLNQAVTLEIFIGKINNEVSLGRLNVNGSVNLGGSTLTVTPSSNAPAANTTSVIIDNDGSEPVNGTFSGLSEGAIITSGINQFQLSYVGGDGNDVTLRFLGSAPPTITSHPSNQSVLVGQPASFSVVATGSGTLTYQWQKNMVNIGGATAPTYNLQAAALIDNGARFRCLVTNSSGTTTSNEATLTVSSPPPVIITEENTDVAIALDSVTLVRDPFSLTNIHNMSIDQRTRLVFFIRNIDLLPSENMSAITARAEDAQLNQFPLTLEFVGKVAGFDFTQVVVRLPDNLPSAQTLLVSVTLRGQTSNKASIRMR